MRKQRRSVKVPDHPLATKGGTVLVARVVLYEKTGPGAHPCHWCGSLVRWQKAKAGADVLCADHLNGDTLDDSPENLVPSCRGCNGNRAQGISHRVERGCEYCGVMFLPRRTTSRFCGLSCSSRSHKTQGEWREHGKRASYVRGCRCAPCKAAQSEYMRAYYQRRKAASVC